MAKRRSTKVSKTKQTKQTKEVVQKPGLGFLQASVDQGITGMHVQESTLTQIPFLKIAVSPKDTDQMNPKSSVYIKGLKAGDMFNPVTKEIYEKPEIVILAAHENYIEWGEGLGSFRGQYSITEMLRMQKEGAIKKEGISDYAYTDSDESTFIRTITLYCYKHPNDIFLITFKKTGLKYARKWLIMVDNIAPELKKTGRDHLPTALGIWKLTGTDLVTNDNNQSWYALGDGKDPNIEFVAFTTDKKYSEMWPAIYAGIEMCDSLIVDNKVDYSSSGGTATTTVDTEESDEEGF